ncbi:hypothetical protein [Acinetobacter baumannii]|uniref:hypothetical protein n=1 Tax=Acinetobacter baumannii TaxID=470 RepID=UPI0002CF27E1|nr:hypothetical protein [Acinetobacter baumannii]ENU55585.1 hypothetical protein F982_00759 [Acinetobacter baumannii NIPH 1362]MDN8142572.1 hypothetical protein [Acinetobacter baumannii]MDN8148337.1 hypothetical protein [Acinetobacter baumannii]MDN8155935.1 hypothetical protein [Acinetobacter baumannii]MDN8160160.1 hypothetical protein [Acinetobacter baumannii]
MSEGYKTLPEVIEVLECRKKRDLSIFEHGFLHGCDYAYEHQQENVEDANAKAQMCRDEKNHAINRWSAVCNERDELQKRINKAKEIADELMQSIENYKLGELLEKILKGDLDEVSKS